MQWGEIISERALAGLPPYETELMLTVRGKVQRSSHTAQLSQAQTCVVGAVHCQPPERRP